MFIHCKKIILNIFVCNKEKAVFLVENGSYSQQSVIMLIFA